MIAELFSLEPVAWLIRGGLLVLGVGTAAAILRRQAASARALLWRGALVGLVLTAPLVMTGWRVRLPEPVREPLERGADRTVDVEGARSLGATVAVPEADASVGIASSTERTNESVPRGQDPSLAAASSGTQHNWPRLVWWVWACGALIVLGRWAGAHARRWRLEKGSMDISSDDRWSTLLAEVAGEKARVRLRQSGAVTVPCAWGLWSPTILVPAAANAWPLEHQRLALAHEWAHLQRRDPLWLVVATIALTLHWANPLAWMLVRRWRLTEEQAADDAALQHAEPRQYATLLVTCARSLHDRSPTPIAAALMAHPSTVPQRVRQILDPTQDRRPATGLQRLLAAAVCLGVLAGVAALTPSLVAQETQPSSPPPAAPTTPSQPEPEATVPALSTKEKLRSIILPRVAFEQATLEEAVEFLRLKSKELDTETTDPNQRGVNFILKLGIDRKPILQSLNLVNVPLNAALGAVCDQAGVNFRTEDFAVVISDGPYDDTELYTKVFRVPPDFLSLATIPATPGDTLPPKPTAMDVLTQAGIAFPEGGAAFFSPITSRLTVRNNLRNLDLVEQFVESTGQQSPEVINLRVEIYRLPKARALAVAELLDTQLDATESVKKLRAEAGSADGALLVAAPSMQTRSGQRARVVSGRDAGAMETAADKTGVGGNALADPEPATLSPSASPTETPAPPATPGKSNSHSESCLFEAEAILGADGYTLDVMTRVAFGSPLSHAGGLPTLGSGALKTFTTMSAGQSRLIGTLSSGDERDTMLLVFLKAAVAQAQ